MSTYSDYSRDRIGWFFGVSGWQVTTLAGGTLPVVWAIKQTLWWAVLGLATGWVLLVIVVAIPVRGRSVVGWCVAWSAHAVGSSLRWTRFAAHATRGQGHQVTGARKQRGEGNGNHEGDHAPHPDHPEHPDLPGILQGVEIHDGGLVDASTSRVALIQDHAARTWAVTAAVVHPGIGMDDAQERRRYGEGLAHLLDVAARTETISEVLFVNRTVPEDGAERDLWLREHRSGAGPALAATVSDDLAAGLSRASVRSEHFVTVVVPEARIARPAREAGGGLMGRSRELHLLMGEVEAQLRGAMGMTSVRWLTSPELALACRTGFAPGDRLGIIEALACGEPGTRSDVPWSMAGPSGADTTPRHYSHDVWNSISVTVGLPAGGVAMGALAPALTPTEAGERRSLVVAYPILRQGSAQRRSANTEWSAETAQAMRNAMGMKTRARQRDDATRARDMDSRLARGNAMVRPYAVCTVTVPKTFRVSEFGRRLDASVRRCGLAPMRLDLCQDAGFAASVIPLGVGLTRRSI